MDSPLCTSATTRTRGNRTSGIVSLQVSVQALGFFYARVCRARSRSPRLEHAGVCVRTPQVGGADGALAAMNGFELAGRPIKVPLKLLRVGLGLLIDVLPCEVAASTADPLGGAGNESPVLSPEQRSNGIEKMSHVAPRWRGSLRCFWLCF